MRLAAQAKMGFYPTPETVTLIIAKHLTRKSLGLIRIFDPCAGEGTALHYIGNHLLADTYGIEIDSERSQKSKEILAHCLITDYQNTRISHNAFSLLWLNPPYDWAARAELEMSERYERTFLRDCIHYICPQGILVYLIPQHRLDKHISLLLSYRFENLSVYRFPEEDYRIFKQLVIFGVLKKNPSKDDAIAEHLLNCGQFKVVIPSIPDDPSQAYEVPLSPVKTTFLFKSREIDPQELDAEIQRHGLFPLFKEMTTPLSMTETIRPIMPLRYGHLAQILACGLMNGVVWDKEGGNPLVVKGITKKEIVHEVEINGDTEKHIETDRITIVISAFNRYGEMLTIT
jgi:hypothetical protein